MAAGEAILSALQRNWNMVDTAVADLDDSNLGRRTDDHSNSVAWILWHMCRVVDSFINTRFQGTTQIWIRDSWHQKFNMDDDPDNRGVGWSAEQVAAWAVPSREALLGYYGAVNAAAKEYITSLSASDLEVTKVIPPVTEPRTVADALGQMTWDNVAHGGQIAFLRGHYLGMGWHR